MKTSDSDEDFEVIGMKTHRDALGRQGYDPAYRTALLEKFARSGLSQARFSMKEGVNYSTFSGWVTRHGKRSVSDTKCGTQVAGASAKPASSTKPAKQVDAAAGFHEMRVESVREPDPVCGTPVVLSVMLPGGIEVRGCDVKAAAELIKTLRKVP